MSVHPNLAALVEKNEALLERIDFDPASDDPFLLDNPGVFRDSGLFRDDAVESIFGLDPDPEPAPETDICPPERINTFGPNIGMLLVRPDMTHAARGVERFISKRFQVLEVTDTVVCPDTYWSMYHDAVKGCETRRSRLTRAAVYVNSVSRLMVFKSRDTDQPTVPVADQVFTNLKGRQGVRTAGTLRGELAYDAAVGAGFHTLKDPVVQAAVDPFGAYKNIVSQDEPGPHQSLEYPLLFFTGVGIHVPNHAEMQRDLSLLLPYAEELIDD